MQLVNSEVATAEVGFLVRQQLLMLRLAVLAAVVHMA
jgi:hypothetical protein